MSKSILAVLLFGLANVHAWVTVARAPLTLTIAVSSRPGLLSVESRTSMALSATTPPFDQTENPRVSVLRRSYEAYEHLCATKPFITKSITASIIVAIGNIISQSLQATLRVQRLHLNLSQVGAFALTGLLYIGPFYHVWYEQLWRLGDWMEARYGCSKAQQTLAQNFADQSLGVAVFFPIYFFVYEVFEALMSWRGTCTKTQRPLDLAVTSHQTLQSCFSPSSNNHIPKVYSYCHEHRHRELESVAVDQLPELSCRAPIASSVGDERGLGPVECLLLCHDGIVL